MTDQEIEERLFILGAKIAYVNPAKRMLWDVQLMNNGLWNVYHRPSGLRLIFPAIKANNEQEAILQFKREYPGNND